MYKLFFKPFIDLVLALFAIAILLPVFLISAILIKITSSGPVFFIQDRVGKKGRIFDLYKFRTMFNKKRSVNQEIFKDNIEVTKVGYFLRRLKIDELPQIFNILKGDMSIVGPRPCLPSQIPDLDENGTVRLLVKPGLTGLAQVNGNIYLSWRERWEYDRKYVENISFLMDVKIILKTVGIVIVGEEKFLKKPVER